MYVRACVYLRACVCVPRVCVCVSACVRACVCVLQLFLAVIENSFTDIRASDTPPTPRPLSLTVLEEGFSRNMNVLIVVSI